MAQAQVLGKAAGLGMDADALRFEQARQRQFGGAVHPGLQRLLP